MDKMTKFQIEDVARLVDQRYREYHNYHSDGFISEPDWRAWIAYCTTQEVLYRDMVKRGLKIEFVDEYPYQKSTDLFAAIETGHFKVCRTVHPTTMHPAGRTVSEFGGETYNSLARAVHDYYAHFLPRNSLETFDGQIEAYRVERELHGAVSQSVLFAENIGLLCWYRVNGRYPDIQAPITLEPDCLGREVI